MQKCDRSEKDRSREGLYASRDRRLQERGGYKGHLAESSVYTKSVHSPKRLDDAFTNTLGNPGEHNGFEPRHLLILTLVRM